MAEQKKAASAGDHNAVAHELVTEEQPETTTAAKRTSRSGRVRLQVRHPHEKFDLSGVGLASVTQAGVDYSTSEADKVRTLAMKYGVPVYEVRDETEKES